MGCIYAAAVADHRRFCRTPAAKSEEEANERLKKRAEADDANAIHNLEYLYHDGDMGFPQDREKAMELWLRAGVGMPRRSAVLLMLITRRMVLKGTLRKLKVTVSLQL